MARALLQRTKSSFFMIEVRENNQIVTKNYLYSVQCTFYACIIVFIYRRPITTLQSKSEIYIVRTEIRDLQSIMK